VTNHREGGWRAGSQSPINVSVSTEGAALAKTKGRHRKSYMVETRGSCERTARLEGCEEGLEP